MLKIGTTDIAPVRSDTSGAAAGRSMEEEGVRRSASGTESVVLDLLLAAAYAGWWSNMRASRGTSSVVSLSVVGVWRSTSPSDSPSSSSTGSGSSAAAGGRLSTCRNRLLSSLLSSFFPTEASKSVR